jgi:hypothetical protein
MNHPSRHSAQPSFRVSRNPLGGPSPREIDEARGRDRRDLSPPPAREGWKPVFYALRSSGQYMDNSCGRLCSRCLVARDPLYYYPRTSRGPAWLCGVCEDQCLPYVDVLDRATRGGACSPR